MMAGSMGLRPEVVDSARSMTPATPTGTGDVNNSSNFLSPGLRLFVLSDAKYLTPTSANDEDGKISPV